MADDIASLGFSVDSSQAKTATTDLNNLAKAAKDVAEPTRALESAAKRAGVSVDEMRQRVAAAGRAAVDSGKATEAAAASHARMSTQAMALSHAMRSSVEQIAMGVPITQVLTQQMNHLTYAASGPQGLAGAFGEVKTMAGSAIGFLGGLLTPARLAAGGVIGMGAAALTAAYDWDTAQKSIDRSLIGVGQRTGATIADINKFVGQTASASNIATGTARDVLIELVKSGGIYKENLTGIASLTRNVSILTGQDMTEAAKSLGAAFSGDLVTGAEKLNSQFGFLDGKTRELIRTLQEHNKVAEAQKVLIDAVAPSIDRATQTLSIFERAWNAVSKAASDAKNAIGAALSGPTDQQRKEQIIAQRDALLSGRPGIATGGGGGTGLQGDTTPKFIGGGTGLQGDDGSKARAAGIAELNKQLDELRQKEEEAAKAAADARFKQFSIEADDAVRALIPQIEQTNQLTKAIEDLNRAQSDPNVGGKQGLGGANQEALNAAQLQKAVIAETRAEEARRVEVTKQIADSYGDISIKTALTLDRMNDQLAVAEKHGAAAKLRSQEEATTRELIRQGTDAEEAGTIAAKQRQISEAQINESYHERTRTLQEQNELLRAQNAGASDSELARIRAAQVYRDAIRDGASSTEAAAAAAATLQNGLLKAAQNAERMAKAEDAASQAEFKASVSAVGGTFNPTTGSVTSPFGENTSVLASGIQVPTYDFGGRHYADLSGGNWIKYTGYKENLAQAEALQKQMKTGPMDILAAKAGASNLYDEATRNQYQMKLLQLQRINEPNPFKRQVIDIQIQDLIAAMNKNTEAVDANTAVTLNPLYSSGHGALAIGYYKAATGLDMMVRGGTPGVDSVPVHIMAQQGERVRVIPSGSNDNNRSSVTTIINVSGNDTPQRRRSARQIAQNFVASQRAVTG
jgi:hypothetical protein